MSRHYSPRSVTIVGTEVAWIGLTLVAAFAIDVALRRADLPFHHAPEQVGVAMALYLVGFYYCDLYNFSAPGLRDELLKAVLRAFSALAIVFGAIFVATAWLAFDSLTIFVHLVLTLAFVVAFRTHIDAVLTRFEIVTRIAIVGTGSEARLLAGEILAHREHGHQVCCFVATNGEREPVPVGKPNPGIVYVPVVGSARLLDYVREVGIKRILVATADVGDALPVADLLRCKTAGYEVEDGHTFYERLIGRILLNGLSSRWLIFSNGFVRSAGTRAAKRVIDVVASACLLVVTAPLCALVALAIKLEDGGPVFYRQRRVGRHDVCFDVIKFRSMRVDAEADTGPKWAEEADARVTRVGRWIRTLRIDEIPQAWNVLRGEMSFVGPRPERPEFVAELRAAIPFYDQRHGVAPGITGWAQVRYPYGATVEDARRKLEYDLYYLKNFSVLMDALIIVRTFKIILFGWGSR